MILPDLPFSPSALDRTRLTSLLHSVLHIPGSAVFPPCRGCASHSGFCFRVRIGCCHDTCPGVRRLSTTAQLSSSEFSREVMCKLPPTGYICAPDANLEGGGRGKPSCGTPWLGLRFRREISSFGWWLLSQKPAATGGGQVGMGGSPDSANNDLPARMTTAAIKIPRRTLLVLIFLCFVVSLPLRGHGPGNRGALHPFKSYLCAGPPNLEIRASGFLAADRGERVLRPFSQVRFP